MHRRLAPLLLAASVATGCFGAREVVLTVEASDEVGVVDQLVVEVHSEALVGPHTTHTTAPFMGLPQSLVVLGPEDPARETIRVHVRGLRADRVVGEGDAVVTTDGSARVEATVRLEVGCLGVSCPRLNRCDPARGACDGTCVTDDACASSFGCPADARCERGPDEVVGSCRGTAPDADGDGAPGARCAWLPETEDGDCDDTTALADRPICGDGADHDCDGRADELQLCASSCGAGAEVMGCFADVASAARRAECPEDRARLTWHHDRTVIGVAGVRESAGSGIGIVVAEPDGVSHLVLEPRGVVNVVSTVEIPGVTAALVQGPLVAVASSRGLELLAIDDGGALRPIGDPVDVGPSSALALFDETVWVGGLIHGLVAVDVSRPEAPRVLGRVDGPEPRHMARLADGVLVASAERPDELLLYPAPAGAPPGPPVDVTDDLVPSSGRTAQRSFRLVDAAVQPSPEGSGAPSWVVISGRDLTSPGPFLTSYAFDPAREDGRRFDSACDLVGPEPEEACVVRDRSLALEVHLDGGLLTYVTLSGAVGALPRGPTGLGFDVSREATVPAPAPEGPPVSAAAITTTEAGRSLAVVARERAIHLVLFGCE